MRNFVYLFLLLTVLAVAAHAQSPRIELETVVASGLSRPVLLTHSRDGSGRRFIVEQIGRISVLQPNGARTTFLDIRNRLVSAGEQGLLGLTFHPSYASNGRFFVNYTRTPDGDTVIAEYRVSASDPNQADPNSERILLVIGQPFDNHNGGMIEFGPDGLLYIGMGDGGSGNDPGNRAQNLDDLLGKMLRIDVDNPASASVLYSSPSTNPFFGAVPGRDEIFAVGFRNPWRFSFDRRTGHIYAGDVGQSAVEEVDLVTIGGNYGWRVFEGTRCTNLGPASCSSGGFTPPIAEYPNRASSGGRCSVTGGYVYRGSRQSLPYGAYIFGDYCTGEILMLKDGVQTLLRDAPFNISSFGEDEAGELYVIAHGGAVYRMINPDVVVVSQRDFGVGERGALSLTSTTDVPDLAVGYARIQRSGSNALPDGMAIFSFRQSGVIVSEASVAAAPLITSGRVYAEVTSTINTGVAFANPNTEPVTIEFYFTREDGQEFGRNTTTISANSQVAAFLNQGPFNSGDSVRGTFTFTASLAVSAVALRGFTNERGEFLLTTLPVVPITSASTDLLVFPHFADGGGWATEFVLVNATDQAMSGNVQMRDSAGKPASLTVNGEPAVASFSYSLAPRSARRFVTSGAGTSIRVGSARIVPSGASPTPAGFAIFRLVAGGVTVTEAGVHAIRGGTAFRGYVERSATIRTGLALANLSATSTSVTLELIGSNGVSTGLSGSVTLPANGHTSLFLNDIPGFTGVPAQFQGLVRITAPSAIAVTALRGRSNERGDFLITTTTPRDESVQTSSSELLFPHLAIGGGYEMQFILFGVGAGTSSSGTVYLFTQVGSALPLALR